jgi:hypothetical protein
MIFLSCISYSPWTCTGKCGWQFTVFDGGNDIVLAKITKSEIQTFAKTKDCKTSALTVNTMQTYLGDKDGT